MRKQHNIFYNIDWITVILFLSLVFAGWVNIYAAVYNEEYKSILDVSQSYGKQLRWILISIVLATIILFVDAKFFTTFSYLFYAFIIVLLITVPIFGKEVSGARSWFQFGAFKLQPSEFAKFATALALSKLLSTQNVNIKKFKFGFAAFAIFLLPTGLIMLQPDTGSAIIFMAFILVMYREGLSGSVLLMGVVSIALFVLTILIKEISVIAIVFGLLLILFIIMKRTKRNIISIIGLFLFFTAIVLSVGYVYGNLPKHQKTRINVMLGKESDPQGVEYNVRQSKIAIGSGGFTGKGFLKGTQTKYDFVPEQSTDFIFCTVGEEWGFLGAFSVICMFVGLVMRLVFMAERQKSKLARLFGYSVASILFFHFFVNIGMTIGLIPVIGIPLPFFSYGGSSLISFTILLFIFIKLDSNRYQLY